MSHGTCTAQRRNGSFCDLPSMPETPFPICPKHAAKIYAHLRDQLGSMTWTERANSIGQTFALPTDDGPKVGTVYYVRMGGYIKIGYTQNLAVRMRSYVAGDLLAKERGSPSLEGRRLQQFREHLARGKEWFHPAPELMEHIDSLAEVTAT